MTTPTPEQRAAVRAFGTGLHLVLQAGAGTGKTTTLSMLAAGTTRRGIYIAFNKAVTVAARQQFGPNVSCKTGHGLAFAAVGNRYAGRLNASRVPSWTVGRALGIRSGVTIGPRQVSDRALSHTALQTVRTFCRSADPVITARHVPRLRTIEAEELHARLVEVVLPHARQAWADLQHPDQGVVRFEHDHYLKIWALTEPELPADFLLLDEAQDINPVIEGVFNAQREHAQLVLVGDSAQAIYGWRGARDVMTGFDGVELQLSRSFRFGPRLAREANRWLRIADAPIRLQGSARVDTTLGRIAEPDAILCRTNAGAMLEVMQRLDSGRRVALVGGGSDLQALARAAGELRAGRHTTHHELALFTSWGELQEYAEDDPAGHDLIPLVDLINEQGADAVLKALARLSDEAAADVTVSTAHRAKGREWSTVRISEDFLEPEDPSRVDASGRPLPGRITPDEARLAYVAVTRAQHRLDLGGLSWIDHHPQGT